MKMTATPKTSKTRVRRGCAEDQARLRARIVAAAVVVYQRDGLQAFSMRSIAALLELSPMALYRYFPGKAALVQAMWDFILEEVHHAMVVAVAGQPSARQRLLRSFEAGVKYWEMHPDHFKLVFMTDISSLDGHKELPPSISYSRLVEFSNMLMNEFVEEVGGHPDKVSLARDIRMSFLVGYLHARIVNVLYPWSDLDSLRDHTINAMVTAVERCLCSK